MNLKTRLERLEQTDGAVCLVKKCPGESEKEALAYTSVPAGRAVVFVQTGIQRR